MLLEYFSCQNIDGEDFIGGEQIITFSAEVELTRQCVRFTIIDDNVPEVAENFLILLQSPLSEVDFQPLDRIEVSIMDDDCK